MRCSKCDENIINDSTVCPFCGNAVTLDKEYDNKLSRKKKVKVNVKKIENITTVKGFLIIGCILCVIGAFVPIDVYYLNYSTIFTHIYDPRMPIYMAGIITKEMINELKDIVYIAFPIAGFLFCIFDKYIFSAMSGIAQGIIFIKYILKLNPNDTTLWDYFDKTFGFYIMLLGIILMIVSGIIGACYIMKERYRIRREYPYDSLIWKKICNFIKRQWLICIALLFVFIICISTILRIPTLVPFLLPARVAYDYKIKPGTEEWSRLNTEEAFEVCVVPDDILARLTTKALVKTIADYPFLVDGITIYHDIRNGIRQLSVGWGFYGVEELKTRSDAIECLHSYLDEHKSEYEAVLFDKSESQTNEYVKIYEVMGKLLEFFEKEFR